MVSYDRITVEFSNSERPGGGDGTMDIETGVFTTDTSGYYIITYSGLAHVLPGEYTDMLLYYNGFPVEESHFQTYMIVGGSGDWIRDRGSRTAESIDCLLLL